MLTAEELANKYFPGEKLLNKYSLQLLTETRKVFGIPLLHRRSTFGWAKGLTLIESDKHLFLDTRFQISPWHILWCLIPAVVFWFFLRDFLLANLIGVVTIYIPLSLITSGASMYFWRVKGFDTEVYKKEWASLSTQEDILSLSIKVPKYSRISLLHHLLKSKFFDFLGVTITSADLDIDYKFKILDKKL
ncbi:MAG: hypothetical protein A3I52_02645 [Candidatus Blackburnbacteria bacterium RIFCSPLOWO2_02_FULL_40_10]|nr:MAG: hypothetical protein A3I52_02645 [Candidatus Blackburnbacteria bacterium RIFCSPLOWO2_02_FULL_40_10]